MNPPVNKGPSSAYSTISYLLSNFEKEITMILKINVIVHRISLRMYFAQASFNKLVGPKTRQNKGPIWNIDLKKSWIVKMSWFFDNSIKPMSNNHFFIIAFFEKLNISCYFQESVFIKCFFLQGKVLHILDMFQTTSRLPNVYNMSQI